MADPGHDLLGDYVSWLADGPYAWLAALGVAGLAASAALGALHLRRDLQPGPVRDAAAAFLGCATVLAAGTLLLPSRGLDEPWWRTVVHVALAFGAYAGILGAAVLLALRGPPGLRLRPWCVLLLAAFGALSLAAAAAKLTRWDVDLRGVTQLGLVAAAAAWLAAAGSGRRRTQS